MAWIAARRAEARRTSKRALAKTCASDGGLFWGRAGRVLIRDLRPRIYPGVVLLTPARSSDIVVPSGWCVTEPPCAAMSLSASATSPVYECGEPWFTMILILVGSLAA